MDVTSWEREQMRLVASWVNIRLASHSAEDETRFMIGDDLGGLEDPVLFRTVLEEVTTPLRAILSF